MPFESSKRPVVEPIPGCLKQLLQVPPLTFSPRVTFRVVSPLILEVWGDDGVVKKVELQPNLIQITDMEIAIEAIKENLVKFIAQGEWV